MIFVLLFFVVCIDCLILIGAWRIARRCIKPFAAALWKAAGVALVFTPAVMVGGDGCLPAPAAVALLFELKIGSDPKFFYSFPFTSMCVVFLLVIPLFWITSRRERKRV